MHERPASLTNSMFQQAGFVCQNCRCVDCDIVLDNEIKCKQCGERHGMRSIEDPAICADCQRIRLRVAKLPPKLLLLRKREVEREEPIYYMRSRSDKDTDDGIDDFSYEEATENSGTGAENSGSEKENSENAEFNATLLKLSLPKIAKDELADNNGDYDGSPIRQDAEISEYSESSDSNSTQLESNFNQNLNQQE